MSKYVGCNSDLPKMYKPFSTLDLFCDFSMINKSYCGVSFFGLVFIRISMNYLTMIKK